MHIIVLTSRQNFVWHSMQEIIPYIEKTWTEFSNDKIKVSILNVDEMNFQQVIPYALQATHIVLTCFNFKVFKIACFIRENLMLPVNFIIHVHNMATIAFWPFRKWASADFFKTNDLFISSCENDLKTINAVFMKPHATIIPFFLTDPVEKYLNKPVKSITDLVYVGRISPQKNLHNLILAYSILKRKNLLGLPNLTVFGKEDDLGSPNMNLKQPGYQKYLNTLVDDLGLQRNIIFKGHQSREIVNDFLILNQCLAVSPSLHSDENFGMAILQSLMSGNHCLISDWGGHSDFKKYFSDRINLMKITDSNWGPSLSAQTIADSMKAVLGLAPKDSVMQINPNYLIKTHYYKIQELLKLPFKNENLKFSTLAENIYKQKTKTFIKSSTQIFSGYADPLFREISSYYIGESSQAIKFDKNIKYNYVPWIEFQNENLTVKDPHKGEFQIIYSKNQKTLEDLFRGGYIISED